MADLIDKLNEEKVQENKELKLSENKALVEIINGFEKTLKCGIDFDTHVKLIQQFSNIYTSNDITEFSMILNRYALEYNISGVSGIYLSALMYECNSKNYKINTTNLNFKIDHLGCLLNGNKKLTIIGDVGNELGDSSYGKIILKGNAGDWVGSNLNGKIFIRGDVGNNLGYEMDGGIIMVHGYVGDCCGCYMHGNKIKIYGNVGEDLGQQMSSGIIEVKGNVSSISDDIRRSEITEDYG